MALIGISGKINSGKDTIGKLINFHATGGLDTYTDLEGFLNYYDDGTDMYPFRIKKFADKLKDIVCLLIGCSRLQLEDREFKEKELGEEWWYWILPNGTKIDFNHLNNGELEKQSTLLKLTPRLLLQLLGTECGRQIIHPNIWVNALMSDYKPERQKYLDGDSEEYRNALPDWIITDVRFPNEAQAIKDKGGILIRVNRDLQCEICKQTKAERRGNLCYEIPCPNGRLRHESETALDDYQDFDYIIENDGSIEDLVDKVEKIDYGKVF